VVLGRYRGTLKAAGAAPDAQYRHVYRFRDGKAVTFQQYTDMLRWARLMK
jgi:ketosteroid isomerase-like protein